MSKKHQDIVQSELLDEQRDDSQSAWATPSSMSDWLMLPEVEVGA